jgi:cytochrome c oxidase subunit 4
MSEHVTSPRVYVAIFLALMVLTAITVWVAFQNLGPFNDIVALGIAVTKTCLVILYFMHVRYSSRMTRLTVAAGFLWLAIMIGITLTDYLSRAKIIDTWTG